MQVRVLKGGWYWKGDLVSTGDVLTAPSAEWVTNRMADDLVEPMSTISAAPETAMIEPPEAAIPPAPRARGKR